MSDFHFLRPVWLLALIVLAVLYWVARRRRLGMGDWSQVCDPELLPHLLIENPVVGRSWRLPSEWLFVAAALAILALAGPTWERLPTPAFRNDQALVMVLDLSPAMDATDVRPNRLERARFKIEDILRGRKDGQNALVVYGDDAFTVTPLTDDGATISSQLTALSTGLMPGEAGGHPEAGLDMAMKLLQQSGLVHGDILLISSGTAAERAVEVAGRIRDHGFRVSVLAVGTEAGAPIPLPRGGFKQDVKGGIWVPKLDVAGLKELAIAGGGRYVGMQSDDADLKSLLPFFDRHDEPFQESSQSTLSLEQWQELCPWLLIPVVPLAALVFRRGFLAVCMLVILLPVPEPAAAFEWRNLFLSRDQQAQQAFDRGDFKRAGELFENPDWKAAAQYKSEQERQAANTLKGADSPDAMYNRGNALAKARKYKEAIKVYEDVLKINPGHDDAKANKKIVEDELKKHPERDESGKSQDSDQSQEESESQNSKPSQQERNNQQIDPKNKQQSDQQNQGEQNGNSKQQGAEDRPGSQGEEQGDQAQQGQSELKQQDDAGHESEQMSQSASESTNDKGQEQEKGQQNVMEHRLSEDQQASEQWLRRIPDDPGGLLKRKFQYQYQQRQGRRHQP